MKFHIRLEQLQMRMPQSCSYEPELFPGLVFRMLDPKVTLLMFASGKIILIGANEKSHTHEVRCVHSKRARETQAHDHLTQPFTL